MNRRWRRVSQVNRLDTVLLIPELGLVAVQVLSISLAPWQGPVLTIRSVKPMLGVVTQLVPLLVAEAYPVIAGPLALLIQAI